MAGGVNRRCLTTRGDSSPRRAVIARPFFFCSFSIQCILRSPPYNFGEPMGMWPSFAPFVTKAMKGKKATEGRGGIGIRYLLQIFSESIIQS